MDIVTVLITSSASFFLLDLAVIPSLERKLKVPTLKNVRKIIGVTLVAEIAKRAACLISISLVTVVVVFWLINFSIPMMSLDFLSSLFRFVRSVREMAERLDQMWGGVTILLLTFALWIVTRREAKANADKAIEVAFSELKQKAEEGLPVLDETEVMKKLVEMRNEFITRYQSILENAQKQGRDPRENVEEKTELEKIERSIEGIEKSYHAEDILRRIELPPVIDESVARSKTFGSYLALFFISGGLFKTMSRGAKIFAGVSLLLLVPSFIAVKSAAISDMADAAMVRIQDLIITNSKLLAEKHWDVSSRQDNSTAPLTLQEQGLINRIAQQYVVMVIQRNIEIFHMANTSAEGEKIHSAMVKMQILRDFESGNESVIAKGPSDNNIEALEGNKDAITLLQEGELRGPVLGSMEKAFAGDVSSRLEKMSPSSRKKILDAFSLWLARFHQPMGHTEILAWLETEVLNSVSGMAIDTMPSSSFVMQLADKYLKAGEVTESARNKSRVRIETLRKFDEFSLMNQARDNGQVKGIPQNVLGVPVLDVDTIAKGNNLEAHLEDVVHSADVEIDTNPPTIMRKDNNRNLTRGELTYKDILSRNHKQIEDNVHSMFESFEDPFPGQLGLQIGSDAVVSSQSKARLKEDLQFTREQLVRARTYSALSVYAEMGGVLIGLKPENNGPSIIGLDWYDTPQGIFLDLMRTDGVHLKFGPFRAELVRRALAYAADGRPITVTMPAGGLDRPVLIHPALVDSAIGCKSRIFDQFVDEFTEQHQIRGVLMANAISQQNAYTFAWAVQFVRLSNTSQHAMRLDFLFSTNDQLANNQLLVSVKKYLNDSASSVSAQDFLNNQDDVGDAKVSILAVKTQYFDPVLVKEIRQCKRVGISTEIFAECISQAPLPAQYAQSRQWQQLPPSFFIESGVREEPYTLDDKLSFLDLGISNALQPFRFVFVAMFVSRPLFITNGEMASLNEKPFEFPVYQSSLTKEVAAGVEHNAESMAALVDIREFAMLQRFFRLALDGYLGEQFPVDRLVELGRVKPHAIQVNIRTLNWNNPEALQNALRSKLMAANDTNVKAVHENIEGLLKDIGLKSDLENPMLNNGTCPKILP